VHRANQVQCSAVQCSAVQLAPFLLNGSVSLCACRQDVVHLLYGSSATEATESAEAAARAVHSRLQALRVRGQGLGGRECGGLMMAAEGSSCPPTVSSAEGEQAEVPPEGESSAGLASPAASADSDGRHGGDHGGGPLCCVDSPQLQYMLESESEWRRRGGFERVYPSADGVRLYGPLLEALWAGKKPATARASVRRQARHSSHSMNGLLSAMSAVDGSSHGSA
jgi:hypothetical protein